MSPISRRFSRLTCQHLISYPQQMTGKDAYGANVAFKTQSGAMANLLPSRFLNELGPAAAKAIAG